MNITNFKLLRDRVSKARPSHCDMRDWICNSAMCIGGTCQVLMWQLGVLEPPAGYADLDFTSSRIDGHDWQQPQVRKWLDISDDQAEELFFRFPGQTPVEGWKEWMLARLDACIEAGGVIYLCCGDLVPEESSECPNCYDDDY